MRKKEREREKEREIEREGGRAETRERGARVLKGEKKLDVRDRKRR